MKLDNYCILVRSYDEWIEIQNFLFSKGFIWTGKHKDQLFTSWNKANDLIFPRNILTSYNEEKKCWCLYNVPNKVELALSNNDNDKEIKAIDILRKNKLQSLNEV